MTAIDCFCGAGGLSLGLSRAGIDCSWAFDANQKAVDTYHRNIGAHVECIDAANLTAEMVLSKVETGTFLVAGGPPCQGFSRQRRGADKDERNDLVLTYFSIVAAIKPQFFLMENVPALAGPRGSSYLSLLRKRASEIGYHVHQKILNAADYGVPQFRRRLFLVGERIDGLLRFDFPSPSHTPEHYQTVRQALRGLPPPGSNGQYDIANHKPGHVSELNRLRISHVPPGGGRAHIPEHLQLPCHRVSVEVAGHRNVYGRLSWDRPANTITTKCNSFTRGMFGHPEEDRNITMREAARLQGFPDSFEFLGGTVDVAHQIGNAVPPPLAQALGEALIRAAR